jgi:hypothetical protein
LEASAAEAGVEIWYGCVIFDLVMEEGRVAALFAARPGGLFEIRASATVDSSGDGDVCAAAGAQFTMGRESDGICNFFSLIPGIRKEGRCGFLNFDGGIVDPTSIQDLTRARRLGLSHLRRPEGFTAENRYNYISPMVGLRQSRQIIADYVLTVDDQVVMRHFPDTIAYGSCHLDDHRKDFHNASDQMVFWHWGLGFWDRWIVHELPLRSLLPKNVDGLLVACRALGVTSEAASLFRMQRDMQRVGEAAGVTAALASKQGVTPRGVDVSSVQETLRSRGGMRHIHELWQSQTDPRWANSVYREDLPVDSYPSAQELALRLERSWGSIVLWQLCHDPDHGPALLEEVLLTGGPHARWWASCGLAMLGNPAGAEVLLQTLEARDSTLPLPPDFPVWHDGWKEHTAPRWLVAAVLLGVLRCRRAVTPIAGLLSPRENTPVFGCKEDAEIRCGAAVRALGRIGDSSAEPALREFLKNSEHHSHTHGFSRGGEWLRSGVGFDIGWSLRLAAIEALTKIGVPSPEAAAAFLTHPEPTARRYAEKVYRSAKLALEPLSSAA